MSLTVSSYIPTASGTDARTIDALNFTFNARPQAMSIYLRFLELGSVLQADGTLLHIGAATNTNPKALLIANGSVYRMEHNNNTSTATSSAAATPSTGDIVELVGQLNADGSVQLVQSINGAAAVTATASSTLTLQSAWVSTSLYINSLGTVATTTGYNAFMNVVVIRGVHSLARMRRFAGVKQ